MTTNPEPTIGASPLTGTTVGPFATGFKYRDPEDVRVWLELSGVRQPDLTPGSQYTLTGATPLVNGGTIALSPGVVPAGGWNSAAGDRVVWARQTVKRQALALPDTESHRPRATEQALDKQMRVGEENADQLYLAVKVRPGEVGPDLPPLAARNGRLAWFDGAKIGAFDLRPGQLLAATPDTGVLTGIYPTFTVDSTPASVASRTEAAFMSFPETLQFIRTHGFNQAGDGGGAIYDRWVIGMAALPPAGEGIWWFQSADGARWQLAANQEYFAAMFGALGGEGIDAGPILNAAFAAPMVNGINLGALTHYFTPNLVVPSGKFLRGVSRKLSWLKVNPMTGPLTGSTPRFAVLHQNDVGGFSGDYSLDCQRSGDYLVQHGTPHGVVVYARAGGTCRGTRVRRVNVHNCWGYSFYLTTALPSDGLLIDDVWVEDCRAINTNVGFEATGAVRNSGWRDTYVNAAAEDGGTTLACEAYYHHYGAIEDFTAFNATGRGTAQSGLLIFNTDGVDIDTIKYVNPDLDGTLDFGLFVEGRNTVGTADPEEGALNEIRNVQIHGGRIQATTMGGLVRQATVRIFGTKITGLNGVGIEASAGGVIEFHAPDIEGNADPEGATAALGIAAQGAVMTWYGSGRLAGMGPAGISAPADLSQIDFFGQPQFLPSQGGVAPIIQDRMFRIPRADWLDDTPGVNHRVMIDLSASPVADIEKCILVPSMEFPFPVGEVGADASFSMQVLWIDPANVRVYVITTAAMTGWILKARLIEYA